MKVLKSFAQMTPPVINLLNLKTVLKLQTSGAQISICLSITMLALTEVLVAAS
jgi:hypothetical protein